MKKYLICIGKVSEVLIYAFLLLILFVILSPRLPTKKLFTSYIVPTGSMEPTIHAGSVAFVNPKITNLSVSDIIVFPNPNDSYENILHRVNKIDGENLITKGDNNNAPDNWKVPTQSVKGKLLFSVPYLGYIATFVKKPIGFVILAVIPALFLSFNFLMDVKKGIEEEVDKRKKKRSVTKIVVVFLFFFVLGFSVSANGVKSVFAAFTAQASISDISISVISPTPSPTPTPTPTPQPSSCPDLDLIIQGNGANSVSGLPAGLPKKTIIPNIKMIPVLSF